MGAVDHLKIAMAAKHIKGVTLATLMDCPTQSLYNKFNRDTMKFKEVEKIADLLGCDVVLRDRTNGNIY